MSRTPSRSERRRTRERRDKAERTLPAPVERARTEPADVLSRQPRFEPRRTAYTALYRLAQIAELTEPPYASDSCRRDMWLREFWRTEPHLAGVVNSVILVDANRGWTLTGGRNQVSRYTAILQNAEDGQGWRTLCRKAALSYWCTDMGAVLEVGRDGANGPMRALYHVDSARCRLTGNRDEPLEYIPALSGSPQKWGRRDFLHVASMPSDDESMNGLGFCALSRCLEIIKLLRAVLIHDQEKVAARAPKGVLLLHGISLDQWNESLEARDAKLDGLEREFYGGVHILASTGVEQITMQLVGLSQLPDHFDPQVFTDLALYTIALCFGYDPSEFWPVRFGTLGRGTETEVMHLKATGKGGTDLALALQEQIQLELPPTLLFEFEQRDDSGNLATANVKRAQAGLASDLYNAGLSAGMPLVSREEARVLLAEEGLIPEEWTAAEEDVTGSDTEMPESEGEVPLGEEQVPVGEQAERWLEMRGAWPEEQVVRAHWPSGKVRVLYDPARRRRQFTVGRAALYDKGGVKITKADLNAAIAEAEKGDPEWASLLTAPVYEPEA